MPRATSVTGAEVSNRIRVASLSDVDGIAHHRVRIFQETEPAERTAELESFFAPSANALRAGLSAGTTLAWVAEDEAGRLVGSLVMHLIDRLPSPKSPTGHEGYISHVYVTPEARDHGVGAMLLGAAVDTRHARRFSRIRLHAVDRAIPFYRRAGFVVRRNDMELLCVEGD